MSLNKKMKYLIELSAGWHNIITRRAKLNGRYYNEMSIGNHKNAKIIDNAIDQLDKEYELQINAFSKQSSLTLQESEELLNYAHNNRKILIDRLRNMGVST